MITLQKLAWLVLVMLLVMPGVLAQDPHSVASLVERIVREKEPTFRLATRGLSGFTSTPSEDDHVSFNFKTKGQEVYVGTTNQKTVAAARFQFGANTITQRSRPGFRLTPDGLKLVPLVDELSLCRNRSPVRMDGQDPTFDVVFRKGTVVIIVESRKPEIAQRIALYIAENLAAK